MTELKNIKQTISYKRLLKNLVAKYSHKGCKFHIMFVAQKTTIIIKLLNLSNANTTVFHFRAKVDFEKVIVFNKKWSEKLIRYFIKLVITKVYVIINTP